MHARPALVPLAVMIWLAGAAHADTVSRTVTGTSSGGQPVALQVTIDFTPTGGNFALGTGTATGVFTLENVSGLFPFHAPPIGNPLLTGFFFNVPPAGGMSLTEARILAGATLYSTGITLGGVHIEAGCESIAADTIVTPWYALQGTQSTGQFGIFTSSLATDKGNKPSLADPELFVSCVKQGDVFAPLVIAGRERFTVLFTGLGPSLHSANDFLNQCSTVPGAQIPSALGGKFQNTDAYGVGSAFVGDPCFPTPVRSATWGALKAIYR